MKRAVQLLLDPDGYFSNFCTELKRFTTSEYTLMAIWTLTKRKKRLHCWEAGQKAADSGNSNHETDSHKCTATHKSIPLCWAAFLVLTEAINKTTNGKKPTKILLLLQTSSVCLYYLRRTHLPKKVLICLFSLPTVDFATVLFDRAAVQGRLWSDGKKQVHSQTKYTVQNWPPCNATLSSNPDVLKGLICPRSQTWVGIQIVEQN